MPGQALLEPVASSLLNYFSPTRSPYYTVAVASCVALAWVCDVTSLSQWLVLAVPAFIVAGMTLWLSLDAKNTLTASEHAEQLRFARSTSISFAVLSLAFAGKYIAMQDSGGTHLSYFYWAFGLCSVQIVVFLVFCWALNREGILPGSHRNYVQLTLLTSAFLVDSVTNLALASTESSESSQHHLWTTKGLAVLWGLCVLFWLLQLKGVIKFVRPESAQEAQPRSVS